MLPLLPSAAVAGRRALAALLILVVGLAGAGRAAASVADPLGPSAVAAIVGFAAPICHSGGGPAPTDPDTPAPDMPAPHGDCCDACALLAPAVVPGAPSVPTPGAIRMTVRLGASATAASSLPQQRDPRQSRSPPRG